MCREASPRRVHLTSVAGPVRLRAGQQPSGRAHASAGCDSPSLHGPCPDVCPLSPARDGPVLTRLVPAACCCLTFTHHVLVPRLDF